MLYNANRDSKKPAASFEQFHPYRQQKSRDRLTRDKLHSLKKAFTQK